MPETIHLHPRAELVPPAILEPPAASDGRFLMRDLASVLLDRHLRRLARMRNPLELRLARRLRRMHDLSGHLDLGFARLGDYATERLGLSSRRLQSLLQLERGLRDLPAIADAFESGRLSQSQALLLLRVATPGDEAGWLEAAAGRTVRRLERAVREALASRRAEAPETGDPATAAAGDEAGAVVMDEAEATTGDQAGAGAAAEDEARAAAGDPDDDAEPGVEIGFTAPRSLRARWDFAVELCRRAAGAGEPVWRCAEFFAAEYLAGVPDLPALLARGLAGDPDRESPGAAEDAGEDGPGCAAGQGGPGTSAAHQEEDGVELFEEVLRAFQDDAAHFDWAPPDSGFQTVLPDPPDAETGDRPRSIDASLVSLIRLRQTLAWHQGRLLRTFAAHRLYRDLGFLSLGRYCVERLGIGLRRARRLIALERRLLELPVLARAYREGEVTWVQATEIARVANEFDEQEWIRLARSVTVRRLAQEVTVALARAEDALRGNGEGARQRSGPPGLEPSGRVALRAPVWPAGPAADGGAEVQTSAADGGGAAVQTSAEEGDGPVQSSAPMDDDSGVQTSADGGGAAVLTSAEEGGASVQSSAPDFDGTAGGWTRIRFWAPHDVGRLWRNALQVCRWRAAAALDDWQCAERLIDHFRLAWEVRSDPAWRRRYRTHERDGWRCRVPGCSSRRNLQEHHVVFRSQGGDDDPENLVSLCATHHLRVLHPGHLRCHRLPEGLLAWELGAAPDGSAFLRYVEDVRWEAATAAGIAPQGTTAQAGATAPPESTAPQPGTASPGETAMREETAAPREMASREWSGPPGETASWKETALPEGTASPG